jgi:hypothetical protein
MSAYAVAHMRHVTMGPPIVEYLEKIDVIVVDGVDRTHRATDVLGVG